MKLNIFIIKLKIFLSFIYQINLNFINIVYNLMCNVIFLLIIYSINVDNFII